MFQTINNGVIGVFWGKRGSVVRHLPLVLEVCYDIKPVRKEEGKSYWKIPLCDDDATREK